VYRNKATSATLPDL